MSSNITVSGLVVAPGVQQTYAQWEVDDPNVNGLPYLQLDRVELWASETNDRDSTDMMKVAEGITFANYVYTGFAKRYHWIRARDREGQYGDWYPSGATSGVVAGGVWQDFETTVSSSSGSITSYEVERARYFKIGPNVTFHVDVNILINGTADNRIDFTLPISTLNEAPIFGYGNIWAAAGKISASTASLWRYDGEYLGIGSSTWSFQATGTYESSS